MLVAVFETAGLPTATPEVFSPAPLAAVQTVFKMESDDFDQLQSVLKHRYTVGYH